MSVPTSHVRYRVPYADTDQMQVVYYANYLIYFERARNQLLLDCDMPYRQMEAQGMMLPVMESHVDYKDPATFDDVLDLHAWVGWVKGARLRINCEVRRDGALLASGYTVHALVNRDTWRPMRAPQEICSMAEDENGGQ